VGRNVIVMELKIVKYSVDFLNLSWEWFLDDELKFLTGTEEFTKQDQLNWYSTLNEKQDYLVWGVTIDGKAVGACGLKNIINSRCEYWGYIADKSYWGQGFGRKMLDLMELKAIELGCNEITLKVIKENQRAYALYVNVGFSMDYKQEEYYFMSKSISR
jgi:RimJ/RimL family protein N-acetyltransferase